MSIKEMVTKIHLEIHKDTQPSTRLRQVGKDVGTSEQGEMCRKRERISLIWETSRQERIRQKEKLSQGENLAHLFLTMRSPTCLAQAG